MAHKLDDDTLQRYYDGDLSPLEASSVRNEVAASPAAQARLAELEKLSEMMKHAAQEFSEGLDSAALFAGIEADIAKDRVEGAEHLRVVASEWVEHRRSTLVSIAGAIAVAAAVLLMVPNNRPAGGDGLARTAPAPREERRTALANNAVHGTQIENVDFGESTGTVFAIESEGIATAVVWIADEEETP